MHPAQIQAVFNPIESPMFKVYPVPFKENFTIVYEFDYETDVLVQVFDSTGRLLITHADNDSYYGKEVKLQPNFNTAKGQLYLVKVTTNKGSSVKKVISEK